MWMAPPSAAYEKFMLLATDQHHDDAATRIQRTARARRVRLVARMLTKLPIELREHTVQIACWSSVRQLHNLQASVERVVMARFAKTGISLGHALADANSWQEANLGAHLAELREAYALATKYHECLSLSTIGDMLNAALFYIARCHYDGAGDWMLCQLSICAFTRAVLEARAPQERRESALSMGLKSMIELTCIMIGA